MYLRITEMTTDWFHHNQLTPIGILDHCTVYIVYALVKESKAAGNGNP